MRSAASASTSASATRLEPSLAFEMPSYTSHAARAPPPSLRQQPPHAKTATTATSATSIKPPPGVASYSESDANLLEMLSSTVACLRDKHMDLEALGCMEQRLWLQRRMFGLGSPAVQRALQEVVLSYNSLAMQSLAQGQFDQCLGLLRKAEAITGPGNFAHCQSLQILTFNNIGCCYRKLGKLKSALKYLQEAARVGAGCAHVRNLSITHLNLCAIQSQLGRHDLALEHAQAAIFHTQEELVGLEPGVGAQAAEESPGVEPDGGLLTQDVLDAKSREEKLVSLAVAYHNLAVELEFNGRGEASLQWYKKALQLVWPFRERNAALCESFQRIFADAKRKHEPKAATGATGPTGAAAPGAAAKSSRGPARPKSAHPSTAQRQSASSRDLSYSATVASQCYKPTKPSTAGLQYARDASAGGSSSSSRPTSTATTTTTRLARPSSAGGAGGSGPRRRPLSASAQGRSRPVATTTTATATTVMVVDSEQQAIDARWHEIERELFGLGQPRPPEPTRPTRVPVTRPQSARASAPTRAQRGSGNSGNNCSSTRPRTQRQTTEEDEDDDDAACGVIADEEEDDDDDEHPLVRMGLPDRSTRIPQQREPPHKLGQQRQDYRHHRHHQPARGPRHRRVLDESRGRASGRGRFLSECTEDNDDDDDDDDSASLTASSAGYVGGGDEDEDDEDVHGQERRGRDQHTRNPGTDSKSKSNSSHRTASPQSTASGGSLSPTSSSSAPGELPNQRLSHMEYLRRMKRLAESIRDDLEEAPAPAPARPSTTTTTTTTTTELTPRGASTASSSKLRERLELVRRDSAKSLERPDVAVESATATETIIVEEDRHLYDDEAAVVAAETRLLEAASARRIQSTLRTHAAVSRRRRMQQEAAAARVIQKQTRKHAEEQRRRAIAARRAAERRRQEDQAVRVIQRIYRRAFPRDEYASDGEFDDERDADDDEGGDDDKRDGNGVGGAERPDDDDDETTAAPPTLTPEVTPRGVQTRPSTSASASASTASSPGIPSDDETAAAVRALAATTIQSVARWFLSRSRVATRRARRMSRSYIERQHLQVVLRDALDKEQAFLEVWGATMIQALVRGRQTRMLVDATRIGRHAAATTIQMAARRRQCHVRGALRQGVRSVAARRIQGQYRAHALSRRHRELELMLAEMCEVHVIAATTIQRCWRQSQRRHDRSFVEYEAAACIQALGRGHLARKSYASLRGSTPSLGLLTKQESAFCLSRPPSPSPPPVASVDETATEAEYDDAFEAEEPPGTTTIDTSADDAPALLPPFEPGSPQQRGPVGNANFTFLPARVRELYVGALEGPEPATPARDGDFNVQDIDAMGLTIDDFRLELERCADVAGACSSLDAMWMLARAHPERYRGLPELVKVCGVIDRRIQEPGGFWTPELTARAVAFIDLYRELLGF